MEVRETRKGELEVDSADVAAPDVGAAIEDASAEVMSGHEMLLAEDFLESPPPPPPPVPLLRFLETPPIVLEALLEALESLDPVSVAVVSPEESLLLDAPPPPPTELCWSRLPRLLKIHCHRLARFFQLFLCLLLLPPLPPPPFWLDPPKGVAAAARSTSEEDILEERLCCCCCCFFKEVEVEVEGGGGVTKAFCLPSSGLGFCVGEGGMTRTIPGAPGLMLEAAADEGGSEEQHPVAVPGGTEPARWSCACCCCCCCCCCNWCCL